MRLLVDANLSPAVATRLRDGGFDASHVMDHGLIDASDARISEFALSHDQVVVSADSDFAMLLALSKGTAPSLVLFRSADLLTPAEQGDLLVANLAAVEDDLEAGAVVSLSPDHLRVRPLPLS